MPRKSWWARLPFGVRMTAGTSALLVAIGGGAAGVSALTSGEPEARAAAQPAAAAGADDPGAPVLPDDSEVVSREAAAAQPLPKRGDPAPQQPVAQAGAGQVATSVRDTGRADRTAPRPPRALAQPAPGGPAAQPAPVRPVVTTRTDVETREIPFQTRTVRDPSLPRGARRVQAPGVAGQETLRYLVTLTDGTPTARRLIDTTVTRQPQDRVVLVGVKRADRPADCRRPLRFCVPLGRSAACPPETVDEPTAAREESSAIQIGGSVLLSDTDVELLDPPALDGEPNPGCGPQRQR